MVKERELVTIELESDSELAIALATGREPVTFLSNGRRYIATRDPFDPVRDDNSEEFRAALRAVAGTLTPEEGERLKRDIYRWREEGTRPIDRPFWRLISDG
jgi:hypothetical protein